MSDFKQRILQLCGATAVQDNEQVQELWSGYGQIVRYHLQGGTTASVIAKHIQFPNTVNHPRGWHTSISHERKLQSYRVESHWYQHYAKHVATNCKVPNLLHVEDTSDGLLLVLEDLNASGFTLRHTPPTVKLDTAKSCLSWLACFHAQHLHKAPEGLWPKGTYWHLETRPDEWNAMTNESLKAAAKAIDERLSASRFQTIVHGDAKLANFCFSPTGAVAAVDFQYVGGGCGMKDVAYFISSCYSGVECEKLAPRLLNHYFEQLEVAVDNTIDFKLLKKEWLALYPFAWADFCRFLDGWSPGHWKVHAYSKRMTQTALKALTQ
ncbi:phosphotransferase [Marinoscillum furvescens]|uniref:Thiamine kinase-like enzyme n=1 Tax=Marinoscillum furvescens DSM 4134 TaxID=1122208 RepID=A0A3D9L1G7_MARFU|nr:phosphotransferase [Marinoscillum furvescens]RED97898.1 thiamine kinase-like enzyme [Marinoscillum furvescens DSM 4134]